MAAAAAGGVDRAIPPPATSGRPAHCASCARPVKFLQIPSRADDGAAQTTLRIPDRALRRPSLLVAHRRWLP
ncbi:hypothetical protein GQ55_8G031800 [Panicum hallii var. hallii]|uniref:Uncharacterized protein n=1 Tax=Panicum hallii var. hallii TaxID=1504633 RepID=A0A2T7CK62_9POAL|nr:hypothetical protein GQ55_8G031800 [Panicum hallii var. hallii]